VAHQFLDRRLFDSANVIEVETDNIRLATINAGVFLQISGDRFALHLEQQALSFPRLGHVVGNVGFVMFPDLKPGAFTTSAVSDTQPLVLEVELCQRFHLTAATTHSCFHSVVGFNAHPEDPSLGCSSCPAALACCVSYVPSLFVSNPAPLITRPTPRPVR